MPYYILRFWSELHSPVLTIVGADRNGPGIDGGNVVNSRHVVPMLDQERKNRRELLLGPWDSARHHSVADRSTGEASQSGPFRSVFTARIRQMRGCLQDIVLSDFADNRVSLSALNLPLLVSRLERRRDVHPNVGSAPVESTAGRSGYIPQTVTSVSPVRSSRRKTRSSHDLPERWSKISKCPDLAPQRSMYPAV